MPLPPKPQLERPVSTAPPAQPTSSASPPVALLWAHQLRRENNALLARVIALEGSVKAAVDGVKDETRKMGDGREKVGKEMEGWRERVEGRWEDLGKWRNEVDSRWEELSDGVKERFDGLDEWKERVELKEKERMTEVGEIRTEMRELREGMDTLRKSKRVYSRTLTSSDGEREETTLVAGTQQRFESIELGNTPTQHHPTTKLREVPASDSQELVVRDSMATETPSDMSPEVPETQTDGQLLVETQPRPQRGISENSHSTMDLDVIDSERSQPQRQSRDSSSSLTLVQGSLSLSEYLQLGEEMRAKFPGIRQEGRLVEAFWQGINDGEVKKGMEERLERDGWVWEAIRKGCDSHNEQKGKTDEGGLNDKKAEAVGGATEQVNPWPLDNADGEMHKKHEAGPVEKARKRKRRFIPVVPIDEDEYLL